MSLSPSVVVSSSQRSRTRWHQGKKSVCCTWLLNTVFHCVLYEEEKSRLTWSQTFFFAFVFLLRVQSLTSPVSWEQSVSVALLCSVLSLYQIADWFVDGCNMTSCSTYLNSCTAELINFSTPYVVMQCSMTVVYCGDSSESICMRWLQAYFSTALPILNRKRGIRD